MKYRNVSDRPLYSPASRPQTVAPDEVAEFPPDANPAEDLWEPVTTKKAAKAESEKE